MTQDPVGINFLWISATSTRPANSPTFRISQGMGPHLPTQRYQQWDLHARWRPGKPPKGKGMGIGIGITELNPRVLVNQLIQNLGQWGGLAGLAASKQQQAAS